MIIYISYMKTDDEHFVQTCPTTIMFHEISVCPKS